MKVLSARARSRRPTAWAALAACLALPFVGLALVGSDPAPADAAVPRQAACSGRICVSQTTDLDPNGQSVQVDGSGFDTYEGRGIYVAFCLVPPGGQRPTPCGGGSSGSGSAWFASDSYGASNGATPFGGGGSFSTSVYASPTIGSIDCRRVQCAVVTFTDHRNLTDRSQDSIVPVSFAAAAPAAGAPSDTGGSTSAPTGGSGTISGGVGATSGGDDGGAGFADALAAAAAERLTALPAPVLTVASDGLSVTDGTRTLRVSRSEALPAATTKIRVAGIGYDPAKPIDVALCVAPSGGGAPASCLGLAPATGAAWVAREPSSDGRAPSDTYGADGTFEVEIDVAPEVADGIDCRTASCAIVTRNDATRPNDRSQDLAVPVTFVKAEVAERDSTDERAASPVVATSDDSGSSAWIWIVVGGVLVVAGAVTATLVARRRRTGPSGGAA